MNKFPNRRVVGELGILVTYLEDVMVIMSILLHTNAVNTINKKQIDANHTKFWLNKWPWGLSCSSSKRLPLKCGGVVSSVLGVVKFSDILSVFLVGLPLFVSIWQIKNYDFFEPDVQSDENCWWHSILKRSNKLFKIHKQT